MKKMQFCELPIEWQDALTHERHALVAKNIDTPYLVVKYSEDGRRYFRARRCCRAWNDDKGHSMPFGNGTYWKVVYGAVQFRAIRNVCGQTEYELVDGKSYGKSANGTIIPGRVSTKKEVIAILNKIGIFN